MSLRQQAGNAARELFVIVVGVLVALSLESWWSGRQEAEREAEILVDLAAEFRENRQRLVDDTERNTGMVAAMQMVVNLGPSGLDAIGADSAATLARTSLLGLQTFDPSTAVLRSVIEAGEFGLISDPAVREALAAWDDGLAELARKQQMSFDWQNDEIFPVVFAHGAPVIDMDAFRASLGLMVMQASKHRIALDQSYRQIDLADSALALLTAGRQ